jgi:hypothetical protein
VYLKVPKINNSEEASIEFGLWGYDYQILDKNYPRKNSSKRWRSCLFPSSLFIRTITFYSDGERICIAFDLVPI